MSNNMIVFNMIFVLLKKNFETRNKNQLKNNKTFSVDN